MRDSIGKVWFSGTMKEASETSGKTGCYVVIEIAGESAEPYRYKFGENDYYETNYRIPLEIVNKGKPFT